MWHQLGEFAEKPRGSQAAGLGSGEVSPQPLVGIVAGPSLGSYAIRQHEASPGGRSAVSELTVGPQNHHRLGMQLLWHRTSIPTGHGWTVLMVSCRPSREHAADPLLGGTELSHYEDSQETTSSFVPAECIVTSLVQSIQ